MSAKTEEKVTKPFRFSYPTCMNEEVLFKLEVPVEIPHQGCTRELVQRVINMFHVPVYLEEELNESLAKFVLNETKKFHNERDEKLINQLKNNEINVDGIVKNWEKMFKDNVMEYAEQKGTSDEEVFANAYHKLVHSPALETILQVESSYANTVEETLKNRDEDIQKITQRQTEEMEQKVRLLNTFATEEDINELVAKHFEEQSLAAGRWGSQLDALWQTQRAQYRGWLMATLEEYQSTSALNTPSNSPLGNFTVEKSFPVPRGPTSPPRLEESFTIHLGSQLKQTHNLRIVAMDMLDLCVPEGDHDPSSRLQTALGLYSSEVTAAVLLCRDGPGYFTPHGARLARAAAEYHFPSLDSQLSRLAEAVKLPAEDRNVARAREQSTNPNSNPLPRARARRSLQTGDVYITRHSNLAEVHTVFHLLVDDTLKSGDINSRHPVILGLRNILKTACCNDVTSVTLPLLLTHELTDAMTAAWCMRRAELVLKCVKGFMLETAGWGGAELRSLQLAAPAGIAPALFHSLATQLPEVFRTPTPRYFTTSTT